MKKKVLIVASVASMIDQFIIPSIKLLQTMGYDVDVATNFEKGSTCTTEKIIELKKKLFDMDVNAYQIDFDRKITNLKGVLLAIRQMNGIIKGIRPSIYGKKKHETGNYVFIHCHSPIGGVVSRLVARKNKIKVIYTAHGFHFYKGAPLKNWMLFYPVEWLLSWITNTLITINKEDYERSKKHLHAKNVYYVPGIGIDIQKFSMGIFNHEEKRNELGFKYDDYVILSVGELNKNKNHQIIINALGDLVAENSSDYARIHYAIAGKGDLADELRNLAIKKGISSQIHLLGFRTDIAHILQSVDAFALPSIREGLNVSLMEAIASGKQCLVSNIRGNKDLVISEDIGSLIETYDLEGWKTAITNVLKNKKLNGMNKRTEVIQMISADNISLKMKSIYSEV